MKDQMVNGGFEVCHVRSMKNSCRHCIKKWVWLCLVKLYLQIQPAGWIDPWAALYFVYPCHRQQTSLSNIQPRQVFGAGFMRL